MSARSARQHNAWGAASAASKPQDAIAKKVSARGAGESPRIVIDIMPQAREAGGSRKGDFACPTLTRIFSTTSSSQRKIVVRSSRLNTSRDFTITLAERF